MINRIQLWWGLWGKVGLSGNILVKSNIPKSKFDSVFDIREDYSLSIQNMRKIYLPGFSIQQLWGQSLKMSRKWGSISLVYENSILLIRVQGYRGLKDKLQTVKTVHTLRYSVLKISEYFRGVVFCESFCIYGSTNLGILCSAYILRATRTEKSKIEISFKPL